MTEVEEQEESSLVAIVDRIPMLRIVLSSAGTLGSLIALGYLIDDARKTLLGIDVSPAHTTTEYATLGGAFFVDLIGILWQHPLLALTLIVLVVACAFAISLLTPRATRPSSAWGLGVLLVLIGFGGNAYWADLPIMRLTNLLSNPPLCEPKDESVARLHATWVSVLCSRAAENETLRARLADHGIGCPAPPWRAAEPRKTGAATMQEPHTWFTLEQQYAVNVVATIFLVYLALRLYASGASAGGRPAVASALRAVLLVVAVISVLALPYVYGKVIRPTRYPKGHVLYQQSNENPAQPDKLSIMLANPLALVVAQDSSFVTFYNLDRDPQTQKPVQTFLQIDRKSVLETAVDSSDDLVAARAIDYLDSTPCLQ
jgi:hypothetical protein